MYVILICGAKSLQIIKDILVQKFVLKKLCNEQQGNNSDILKI